MRVGALEAERSNKVWAKNLEDASWLPKTLTYRGLRKSGMIFKHFDLPIFISHGCTHTDARREYEKRSWT